MSCIRFNTPAQRKQMKAMAPAMVIAEEPAVPHPSPEVTESKIIRLRILAASSNSKIRESVASSYNTPEDLFITLAADPDEGVRACVARNESAPREVLRALANDTSERVRGFIALNVVVSANAMVHLADDPSATVRGLVQWRMDVAAV